MLICICFSYLRLNYPSKVVTVSKSQSFFLFMKKKRNLEVFVMVITLASLQHNLIYDLNSTHRKYDNVYGLTLLVIFFRGNHLQLL